MNYGDVMNIKKMSIEQKFGQMLMIGLDAYDINDEIIELIEKYKIGGVILYKKNYTSIESMIDFINKIKIINKNNIPLFIAIDQENGIVNRFPKDINRIYSAYKQACTKNMKIINSVNDITTYLLKSVGINMNFAPDLDILRDEKSKAVGNRSYGKTKEDVIMYGLPFMECLRQNGIIPVVKHFPGHGATNKDSHFTIPFIKKTDALEENDLIPFEAAIKKNAPAIMIGHLRLNGYGLLPASLNKKIIEEKLLQKYSYKGLVVTDDLKMSVLKYIYGFKGAIKKAIDAGNNMIMIKYQKGDIKHYKKLFKKINNYEINVDHIENSFKKIIELKKEYDINNEKISSKINIDLVNKKINSINKYIEKEVKKVIK